MHQPRNRQQRRAQRAHERREPDALDVELGELQRQRPSARLLQDAGRLAVERAVAEPDPTTRDAMAAFRALVDGCESPDDFARTMSGQPRTAQQRVSLAELQRRLDELDAKLG